MLSRPRAILLGGSAGGLEALARLLADLPGTYPVPLIAVLHAGPGSSGARADWLARRLRVPAREGRDGEEPRAPGLYLAPPDYHLLVEPGPRLALCFEEKIHSARPSIDALFESAAEVFGAECLGLLLSGANADGAEGLRALRAAGAPTYVQDPEEAEFPFMPRAGLESGGAAASARVEELAVLLLRYA